MHAKTELRSNLPSWCARPTASFRLVATGADTVYPLGSESFVTVGRNASAKVVLSSLSVSRIHAALMHDSLNQTFLVDLGSSHGTFIGAERLTAFVPTLVTKKSLIRFGTCEIQYLLKTLCAEECIVHEALAIECEEERVVFLNTQLNLLKGCPTGSGLIDDESEYYGRLNTFNFVNILPASTGPTLKHGLGSSSSVATCGSDGSHAAASPPSSMLRAEEPISIRCPANFHHHLSVQFESAGNQTCRANAPSPMGNPFALGNDDLPSGNFGLSISPNKTDNFMDAAMYTTQAQEPTIKRCATEAGVDEQDSTETGFTSSPDGSVAPPLDDDSYFSPRHRRRRMSDEAPEYLCLERSGSRAMSLSLPEVECASIGGSSTGFISSGSMSECEEDGEGKKRKRVTFWAYPMEISDPAPSAVC